MASEVQVPSGFRSRVRADEAPIAFTWARLRAERAHGVMWFPPIGTLLNLIRLIHNRWQWRATGSQASAFGFPLARHMAILLTSQRMIVWGVGPVKARTPTLLGEVPRQTIASAVLPFVGSGWKVVEFRLTDGHGVRLLLDPENAEPFVTALS